MRHYAPYKLDLNLGDYQNTGEDKISKVVFYTDDNKTCVGAADTPADNLEFITIPATGKVTKADLYTEKGLLLSSDITSEYVNDNLNKSSKLTLAISKGGMSPGNPGQPVGENNPYMITTPLQFLNVGKDLAAHYKQVVAVDMSALRIDEFTGTFDGNDYWFSNLDITSNGLFKTNSGTLKNMRIYNLLGRCYQLGLA